MTLSVFSFRSRFPEFKDIVDPSIKIILDLAQRQISKDRWIQIDYEDAVLFWTAHMLQVTQTQATIADINGVAASDLFIRTVRYEGKLISFGERQGVRRAESSSGPGESLLDSTTYGQMFKVLRNRSFPAIMTV